MNKAVATAVLATLAVLAMVSAIACTSPTETRGDSFPVGASPDVTVEVGNGDVDLVVGAAGEIGVTAELRNPEKVEYEAYQEGDSIVVRAKTTSNGRADVTLTVPENTRFALTTGSGSVDAVGVQASGQVQTGSGSVKLEGIRGDELNIATGSGDIVLTNVSGTIVANCGSGQIAVRNSSGSFALNTGSGRISMRHSSGPFALNTGSGDIEVHGELTPGSENSVGAGSGSVTIELADSPSVELDLESDDGEVRVDLPVEVRESSKGRLLGTVGSGEASLTVSTGSGDIVVK